MNARIRMILISACIASTCSAIPIVSATHSITDINDTFDIRDNYDQDFTLTVTGGQGLAYFIPLIFAQGGNTDTTFGNQIDTASASWQSGGRTGGFFVPDFFGNPQARCQPNVCAWIPFTFDVAQDFHIAASARVAYQVLGNRLPFQSEVLDAYVDFNGIGAFTATPGLDFTILPGVIYTLDPVVIGGMSDQAGAPEPESVMLVLAGLLLLPLKRYRTALSTGK